ncbi:MAG: response regulator transcription factor [Flavobacteriales bacterium]|nr:MAG: response regulator transcription factor [Flavobacteriales bacterium]
MVNKILRTVVVDDSELQLKVLSKLIEKHPSLILDGVYGSGMAAQKGLTDRKVDLIFLDVEMPIINGFDFLDSFENRPQIILISGKSEYALKAFDYDVTDYLQKPIGQPRFNIAVQRAVTNHVQLSDEADEQEYIFVNSNLQKKKVYIDDIKWIEALGDYIKLITDNGMLMVLSTMKSFLKKLPEEQFIRIHKSYAVNVGRIDKFNSTGVEIGGVQIPMSRLHKDHLEKALLHD